MAKTALITGIRGQDGAYLSKLLLERGYRVLGSIRRAMGSQTDRLNALGVAKDIEFLELDLADVNSTARELDRLRPDEIYNLAGLSSVANSFDQPLVALEVNAIGMARLLEAARLFNPKVRFLQASTSEMFGAATVSPQDEMTPFRPRSPYAVSKLFSHWQAVSYRESYNFFAACAISFNHESPLRGPEFVTRKITSGLVELKYGRRDRLSLGNLDVRRDWGFAGDYVEGMWRMLQQPAAVDYVLATGISTSVRTFVEIAAYRLGLQLDWSGTGPSEVGIDRKTGNIIIDVNPLFFRPAELMATVGDASRAHSELGWYPSVDLEHLVTMMVAADERRLLETKPVTVGIGR